MAYPPAPPLLLTRRLSSFLHSSLESLREQQDPSSLSPSSAGASPSPTTLQTALLVTPSGKLLAYESPLPVRTLRTHCSVAASLWAIHASSAPSVSVALNQRPQQHTISQSQHPHPPPQAQQQQQNPHQSYFQQQQNQPHSLPQQTEDDDSYHDGSAPVSIAASFNGGAVFVVRKLRCGLLFACSTPAPSNPTGSRPSTATVDPASVTAVPVSVTAASESTPSLPATAITTPSSLLPHSTLPILPKPTAAADSSDGTTTPKPIAVPSKQSSLGSNGGELVGSLIPGSAATAETYETAHTGGEHADSGPDTADRDPNADAASMMTTGTATTIGAGGLLSGGRGRKHGGVTATLAVARRQVDELARLLDEKLGTLTVPDDNIGLNGFC
ncbi:hypothetical protein F503_08868 [Ophiostoma piceae UAMH 11346]|uniref:Uncharacterized protein n=1 Tax=Ophiostoma piceae (strain UAMH 11346) TaxID=1262450 RepID=S3BU72_OPHP1|nr:hypothetical protein F503_08868 [Ophiostoma piceae UAMH 11346]